MRPSVSIITAAYNAESTLPGTLSSVLTQEYEGHIEVIVVDDGSTDKTRAVAEHFAELWPADKRVTRSIRLIGQHNMGQAVARNRAMAVAEGEYIALCDSDDILLPAYVSTAVGLLEETSQPRTFVTCNAVVLNPTGVAHGRTFFREAPPAPTAQREAMLRGNFGSIFTVFPNSFLDDVGYFDEDLRACEDWDYWLRAVFQGWQLIRSDAPHALYRWTGESVSSNVEWVYAAETDVIAKAVERFGASMSVSERAIAQERLEAGPPSQRIASFEENLRNGSWRAAGADIRAAARILKDQRKVIAKAMISRVPGGLPLLRWQQLKRDERVGYREGMRR